jgi:hypothetical protein
MARRFYQTQQARVERLMASSELQASVARLREDCGGDAGLVSDRLPSLLMRQRVED